MFYFKRSLIVVILLAASQANAMWRLIEIVEKQKALSPPKNLSWEERLLEKQDLDGFLAEAEKRGVNPNQSMSSTKETALTLASKKDMSGEIVKKLLCYGGISMNTWETEEAIWSPLYYAVQAGNRKAVALFLDCESLPLSEADVVFATLIIQ